MTTLENRHFVATDSDIERIARDHSASLTGQATVMRTFLQALAGTTIAELKVEPRVRSARERMRSQDAAVVKSGLDALETVYGRFYAVITKALAKTPPSPEALPRFLVGRRATPKAIVQAQATKFRSAKATLRAWIKVGHDITALAPAQLTRSELERETRAVRASANGKTSAKQSASGLDRVARRAGGAAKRLVSLVREVAKYDADRAAGLISEAAGVLMTARAEMSGKSMTSTTTNLKKAVEGTPLDFGNETFILMPFKQPAEGARAN